MQTIEERIKEIAVDNCPDYPNVGNVEPFEHLWAIESSLKGITSANDECHQMIKRLAQKCNMSMEDVCSLWEEMNHAIQNR